MIEYFLQQKLAGLLDSYIEVILELDSSKSSNLPQPMV